MTTYGVTPQGFVPKPVQQFIAEFNTAARSLIASDLDVDPDQPTGQLIGIACEKLAEVWELAAVAYNCTNRGDAEADLLDNIGSLTGTVRAPQRPSFVPCNLTFSAPGTYVAGALVAFVAAYPTSRWTNVTAITVPAMSDDTSMMATSSSHPWGSHAGTFLFESVDDGPDAGNALIAAGAGQLTQKVPVTGWLSVVDNGTVSLGALEELDTPYRARQRADLGAGGNDTLDATRAAILLALQNATPPFATATVTMYENTTLLVDTSTGLPGKSYMAVVYDGPSPPSANTAAIAQAIWANKPGGLQAFGSTTLPVVDSQGTTRTVSFTRAQELDVTLTLDVYYDPSTVSSPSALATAIALAITDASQGQAFSLFGTTITPSASAVTTLGPGKDVIASAFKAIAQGQVGVVDVQNFVIASPTPLADGNLAIGIAQFAKIASVTPTMHAFNPAAP